MTTKFYIIVLPHPEVPPRRRILRFRLESEAGGDTVLERLCDTYPDQRDDLKDATLWKASELVTADVENSNQRIYEWIKEREKFPENEIKLFEAVEDHFPDRPKPPSGKWVNIVVVTPEIIEYMDYQGDPDGNLRRMKRRLKFSRTLGGIASPSDCVKTPAAVKGTVLDPSGPRYGRPSDRYGPPTALFDHALAILQYDLEHLEALTPLETTIPHAYDLVSRSAEFFDEEDVRELTLQDTLEALLPGSNRWQRPMINGAVKPGRVWFEGPFVYLIFELKNEPGLGGDPFLQSLAVYSKIIKQKEYSEFCRWSNLPVVLLSMTGNRLEVSAAVFTDAVYADKLLSLDLHLGPHGPDNVIRVARVFMAINKCTERLRELYSGLEKLPKMLPGVMYPSPTADPPESTIPHLEFFSKLHRVDGTPLPEVNEDNTRHGIYLARMPNLASICDTPTATIVLVKFTAKYNEVAHRLLADHDPPLAPILYHCMRVIGGLYMVVMEYMSNAKTLHRFFVPSPLSPLPDAGAVRQDLTRALDLLHEQNLVFGDLRPLNVLYSPEDKRAFLVDFDRVGRHREDRYSPCLNTELGLGVNRWQMMEKSHDRANLERVMKWLSKVSSLVA